MWCLIKHYEQVCASSPVNHQPWKQRNRKKEQEFHLTLSKLQKKQFSLFLSHTNTQIKLTASVSAIPVTLLTRVCAAVQHYSGLKLVSFSSSCRVDSAEGWESLCRRLLSGSCLSTSSWSKPFTSSSSLQLELLRTEEAGLSADEGVSVCESERSREENKTSLSIVSSI